MQNPAPDIVAVTLVKIVKDKLEEAQHYFTLNELAMVSRQVELIDVAMTAGYFEFMLILRSADVSEISKFVMLLRSGRFKEIVVDRTTTVGHRQIIGHERTERMWINPKIFSDHDFDFRWNLCFVLMPFSEKWSRRVWERFIKPIATATGFECEIASDMFGALVMEDVWRGINQAAIVIADVTGRNPNVLYELGIAHTLGKDVILLTQNIDDVPFDTRSLRHITYEDNVDGLDKLASELPRHLEALSASQSKARNS